MMCPFHTKCPSQASDSAIFHFANVPARTLSKAGSGWVEIRISPLDGPGCRPPRKMDRQGWAVARKKASAAAETESQSSTLKNMNNLLSCCHVVLIIHPHPHPHPHHSHFFSFFISMVHHGEPHQHMSALCPRPGSSHHLGFELSELRWPAAETGDRQAPDVTNLLVLLFWHPKKDKPCNLLECE